MAVLNYEWQELGSATLYNNIVIKIDGVLISQSTTDNTSTLQVRFRNTGTYWRTSNGTATFNGIFTDSQSCATYPNYIYAGDTIFQITKTVGHDANGDSYFWLGGVLTAIINNGTRTANIEQFRVDLPHINRYATITSASNFNDEDNPTIYYSNPASTNVTSLQACISLTGAVVDIAYRDISKTGTSYTFNLTSAERQVLRQATTGQNRTVLFFVKTVIGGETFYNSYGVTFSIVNGNPTINSYTKEETDANVLSVFGGQPSVIIKYASDLLFTINATANKEASISQVTVNNVIATLDNGVYKATIQNADTNTYTITVKDSRGFLTTQTYTGTLVNYVPTSIHSNWAIERVTQVSSDLVLNAVIDAFNDNLYTGISNSVTVQYSLDNENWTTISSSSYTYSDYKITISNLTFSNVISYQNTGTFYLKAYDQLVTSQDNRAITKGIETFSYGESDFQINGDLIIADEDGNNPINVLNGIVQEIGSNSYGTYIKYINGILICYTSTTYKNCNGYSGASFNITLPSTYIDTNYITLANMRGGGSYWANINNKAYATTTTTTVVEMWNNGSATAETISYDVMTIGKWK